MARSGLPPLPSMELACPDPPGCPVAVTLPSVLRTVTLPAGRSLYRVYYAKWGYDEHNPGYGDARFSPIDDPATGVRLPSMYLAETRTAALLETVFHDIHDCQDPADRIVYERELRGMLLAYPQTPAPVRLADLRDPELDRLGLSRTQIASSPAEHYPCTRRLAIEALTQPRRGRRVQGIIWHSRQVELADLAPAVALVLYGEPRFSTKRGSWPLVGPGASSLYDGSGRLLVDEVAETLLATVETDT